MKNSKKTTFYDWFTLVEIMVWILIFSIIIIWWFQALFFIMSSKSTLIDQINMEKETVYFSQKFFEMIKKWWTIDYEEYYNRSFRSSSYLSWHYSLPTWFWNYWTSLNIKRYWLYASLFADDWNDVASFPTWTDVKDIYLISWNKKTRTFFRWNIKTDSDDPSWSTCNTNNVKYPTWTWCLWTIEFLKLDWVDWWTDHSSWSIDVTQYDWLVDTWLINKDFNTGSTDLVAWTWSSWLDSNDSLWQPIFPNTMNIINFKVYPYPSKDIKLAWNDPSEETNIAPYLRISFQILPSWKNRKKIKWPVSPINFSTTISLTDVYSN